MTKPRLAYEKFKLIFGLILIATCASYSAAYYDIPHWIGWPAGMFLGLFVIFFDETEADAREVIHKPFSECD